LAPADVHAPALQLLREHYGRENSFEVARALVNVGAVMVRAGHAQDALAVFKKAITTFTRESCPVHFEMVLLFRLIGDACAKEKEYSNALGSYQEAFDTLKKAAALQEAIPLEVCRLHLGLSVCALGMSKLDDALAACEQAASLGAASQGGRLRGDLAFDVLWQRAKILNERHMSMLPSETEESVTRAHDDALSALKAACCFNELAAAAKASYVFQSRAQCLYRCSQHERALVDNREALRLHDIACKGVHTPVTLVFGSNVAQSCLAVGRCEEALAHWTQTEASLGSMFPNEKDRCAPLMSCTINRAVVLLAMGRKDEAKSAVATAKDLGSSFGVASAVFAVQCVMTAASCSAYLSSCTLLFLLPGLDSSAGSAVSNSVVRSFAASLMKLVKDASNDPNSVFKLSKADVPVAWCGEFADHLSDLSRSAFDSAVQHLQAQLS
jgi:tetratricopeptide (TPR) repeat protein